MGLVPELGRGWNEEGRPSHGPHLASSGDSAMRWKVLSAMMMSMPFSLLVLSMISLQDTGATGGDQALQNDRAGKCLEITYHAPLPYSCKISSETHKGYPRLRTVVNLTNTMGLPAPNSVECPWPRTPETKCFAVQNGT